MTIDVARAIARAVRRDALASANESANWVIRKRKMLRIPSRSESEAKHVAGSMTCFHERSYTMPCVACKRSDGEAKRERERIKALLSIA